MSQARRHASPQMFSLNLSSAAERPSASSQRTTSFGRRGLLPLLRRTVQGDAWSGTTADAHAGSSSESWRFSPTDTTLPVCMTVTLEIPEGRELYCSNSIVSPSVTGYL